MAPDYMEILEELKLGRVRKRGQNFEGAELGDFVYFIFDSNPRLVGWTR